MRTIVAQCAACVLVAGCGFQSSPAPGGSDECGDIKPALSRVVNGEREHDPSVIDITEGQLKAIGALNLDIMGSCTATLVAPDVVLTAAHCVDEVDTPRFLVGESYLPPEATFTAVEWHIHPLWAGTIDGMGNPEYDVAVVIIEGDTEARGIEPIAVNDETLSLIGETVQTVGYGLTDPDGGWNTERWWTTMEVVSESPLVYTVNDDGESGMCQGDSGGPMLYQTEDGLRIVGVASGIDSEDCLGNTYYPRTGSVWDWLSEWIPPPTPPDPCEGETWAGRCAGDTAVWCEDGAVVYHECGEYGWICGTNEDGLKRCMHPCGTETLEGRCDGDMAVWCEDGEVFYHPCGDYGWICGLDAEGRHRCVPPDPCEGVTLSGFCDGDVAVWCEDGQLWWHYCADFGWTCGENEEGRNRCVSPCDLLGHEGECDGDVARWCWQGLVRERDCAACDQTCGWTGDALGYYCM